MVKYVALLRGINVGGKNKLSMSDLRAALESTGLHNVGTYIQSGNVLFEAPKSSDVSLAQRIEQCIKQQFNLIVPVAVFTSVEWQEIIKEAPPAWGKDPEWKHNLLVMLPPYDMKEVVDSIGELKPDIELLVPGEGVLYQSMSRALFGRTTTGKLAAKPIYARMTIRNYNTARKLADMLSVEN